MKAGALSSIPLGLSAALAIAVWGLATSSTSATATEGPDGRLSQVIHRAMRAEGPLFTPAEQAVINAKCGYAPGEWDGFSANISNGVLHCTNGRRVDDAEMRALLEVANPRIRSWVRAVMASPEVRSAINGVAIEARARALRELAARGHPVARRRKLERE